MGLRKTGQGIRRKTRSAVLRRWPGVKWVVLGGFSCVAAVLAVAGAEAYLARVAPDGHTALDSLFLALQVFIVQASFQPGPLPWPLEVARFLAPVATAWTAIATLGAMFREQFDRLRLSRLGGHVVVCALGRKGAALAEDHLAAGDRVVAIDLDLGHAARTCRDQGAVVLTGDATRVAVLERARAGHASMVYAVSPDDGANIEIALQVRELAANRPVLCRLHLMDLDLLRHFRSLPFCNGPGFRIETFNLYENAAREALLSHPLDARLDGQGDRRAAHLVLVGFSRMGQSLAVEAAHQAHFANGRRLGVTVVDRNGDSVRRAFLARYPQFCAVCDLDVVHGEVEDPEVLGRIAQVATDPGRCTTVAVCLDDDRACARVLLLLEAVLKGHDVTVLVRHSGEGRLLESLARTPAGGLDVHTFGDVRTTCCIAALDRRDLDAQARGIHEEYLRNAIERGEALRSRPPLFPWDELEPDLQDSNRHVADHIPVKLRAVGAVAVPASQVGEDAEPLVLTPDEVEMLSRMEHSRWCAERLLAGWTAGPVKDAARKVTNYLVEWEALPEDIREYDRVNVRGIQAQLALVGRVAIRVRPGTARPPGRERAAPTA